MKTKIRIGKGNDDPSLSALLEFEVETEDNSQTALMDAINAHFRKKEQVMALATADVPENGPTELESRSAKFVNIVTL